MENRAERAIALHDQGYNCAQAVCCAYADQFGVDEETAYKMSEGFGFGMGMMETCGALTGAFMLAGLEGSAGTAQPGATKGAAYKRNREMGKEFAARCGSTLCHELKGRDTGKVLCPCADCIREGAALVEQYLCHNGK